MAFLYTTSWDVAYRTCEALFGGHAASLLSLMRLGSPWRENLWYLIIDSGQAGGVTENNESLLRPVAPDGDWRDNAIIGGRLEDDSVLAMGYLKAAEILVTHWKAGHRNDLLVVPIFNLYRHGIELALKAEIREAAARLRADGVTAGHDPGGGRRTPCAYPFDRRTSGRVEPRPRSTPPRPEQPAPRRHARGPQQPAPIGPDGPGAPIQHRQDRRQEEQEAVPARPKETQFDLPGTAETLNDAGTLILHGVSGVLGAYAEYQWLYG